MNKLEEISLSLPVEEYDAYVEELDRLYVFTTADSKRLPIYVADTVEELARLTGRTTSSINSMISKLKSGKLKSGRFDRVEYEGYKGNKTGKSKLTESQAREAYRLHYEEEVTMDRLQEMFGVSRNCFLGAFRNLGLPRIGKPGKRKGKDGTERQRNEKTC